MVIDTNILQSEELLRYFSQRAENFAVVVDYLMIETLKADDPSMIFKSMRLLSQYPKQVIVLKGTIDICGLHTRSAGLQRRMIDYSQTTEFPNYCKNLALTERGDTHFLRSLNQLRDDAKVQISRMRNDAKTVASAFGEMEQLFSQQDIKALRRAEPIAPTLVDNVARKVMELAAILMSRHPKVSNAPSYVELSSSFLFRSALCMFLVWIRWVNHGSPKKVRDDKIQNDLIDSIFSAYATYFDGLLSSDSKLNQLHRDARAWLKIFAPTK